MLINNDVYFFTRLKNNFAHFKVRRINFNHFNYLFFYTFETVLYLFVVNYIIFDK